MSEAAAAGPVLPPAPPPKRRGEGPAPPLAPPSPDRRGVGGEERERPRPCRAHDLVVGPWGARFMGRRLPCSIGRAGVVRRKAEGDLGTPEGCWRLLWLYWRADRLPRPETALPAVALGPQQGWSEAPEDPAYNRPIRHPHRFPADRMARGDGLYDLCAVTDQNWQPAVPGGGSAIFVHLWRRPRWPTAGCVAFRRPDLAWILARWRPCSRLVVRARGGL